MLITNLINQTNQFLSKRVNNYFVPILQRYNCISENPKMTLSSATLRHYHDALSRLMVYVTNFLSPIKTGVEDLTWSRDLQPFFAVCGRAIAQNIRLRVIHRSGGKYPPLSQKLR